MFIKKKLLKSMLYDIGEYKNCIKQLQKEIDEVRGIAYEGGFVVMNRVPEMDDRRNYMWNGIPVAKILLKLFKQKRWDVGRTPPSDIEIREFDKGGLSSHRLK
jgi:hypothetical protein